MPHRLAKLKAALNQTPNDSYEQFQLLRDGLQRPWWIGLSEMGCS